MTAARHAFGQLDLAAAEAGEQREVELADARGSSSRARETRSCPPRSSARPDVLAGAGIVAELVHHLGQLLDLLSAARESRACAAATARRPRRRAREAQAQPGGCRAPGPWPRSAVAQTRSSGAGRIPCRRASARRAAAGGRRSGGRRRQRPGRRASAKRGAAAPPCASRALRLRELVDAGSGLVPQQVTQDLAASSRRTPRSRGFRQGYFWHISICLMPLSIYNWPHSKTRGDRRMKIQRDLCSGRRARAALPVAAMAATNDGAGRGRGRRRQGRGHACGDCATCGSATFSGCAMSSTPPSRATQPRRHPPPNDRWSRMRRRSPARSSLSTASPHPDGSSACSPAIGAQSRVISMPFTRETRQARTPRQRRS